MKKYFYEVMTDQKKGILDQALSAVLWLLSLGYGLVVRVTHALYTNHILKTYQAPKPVVSIGNITTGGTGKTPLVITLVKLLKQKGIRSVVLSRGYGSTDGLNDETKMFRELLADIPVFTRANRRLSIEKALNSGKFDLFIADDAFSHWPLHRDLDIVVIDSSNPFGNGHFVPRGILRESLSSLQRADVFVLTKMDQVENTQHIIEKLNQIKPDALIVESIHSPENFQDILTRKIHSLESLKDKKVIGFCGIGQPSSFEHCLKTLGLKVEKFFVFEDHYHYKQSDIQKIMDAARAENINILVTTHKDAVKIAALQNVFNGFLIVRLNIELKITQGEEELVQRIISLQPH